MGITVKMLKRLANIVLALFLTATFAVNYVEAKHKPKRTRATKSSKLRKQKRLLSKIKHKYNREYGVNLFDKDSVSGLNHDDLQHLTEELGQDYLKMIHKYHYEDNHKMNTALSKVRDTGLYLAKKLREQELG